MIKKTFSRQPKLIRRFWIIFFSGFAFVFLLFTSISLGLLGFMPSFEELENPKSNLASEIYSSDGVLLGTFFIDNRSPIKYDEISPNMVNALLATEDVRFYHHSGIDTRSVSRVLVRNLIGGRRSAGGGSTITQQLAKNLFPRKENASFIYTAFVKLKEWVTAIKLERNYTKEEIIAMYLNTVDFGSHSFGIKMAAKTYFDSTPADLTVEQASMLVGMLQAPSWFHPVRNPERAQRRRNVVLGQMYRYGFLHPLEFDSIRNLPLDVSKFSVQDHTSGLATYFREYIRLELNEWSRSNKKPDGTHYNIYKDGLKIYTTIDSRMQTYAEEAVKEHIGEYLQEEFFKHWKGYENAPFGRDLTKQQIQNSIESSMRRSDRYRALRAQGLKEDSIFELFKEPVQMRVFSWKGEIDTLLSPLDSIWYYKHFLNTGLISIEPQTGHVKAYVGGINYKHFQYDHGVVARRQVGSTFKPFVYTVAMRDGEYGPCSKVPNIEITIENVGSPAWTPRNSSKYKDGELVALNDALANSINRVTAYLINKFPPQTVINLVRRLGITSPIDPVPSIALGSADISVKEMTAAFAAYANKGVYIEPVFITRIEDRNGMLIQSYSTRQEEAMSEENAYVMIECMRGVVEMGTGGRLRGRYGLTNPIAGKTGTTQNNSDGWFMGITPNLATGVWVGGEDRGIRFRTITLGQGANMALPIWALYMQRVYNDNSIGLYKGPFEKPANIRVELNCKREQEDSSDGITDDFRENIF
jgi:penicillin-binding protein 1A